MDRLFATNDSWMGFILRVGLGIVMLSHGLQNMPGWFGGPGFEGAMATLTLQMQLPKIVAVMVIMSEFFGGIALILGAYARIAAFSIACVMTGAIAIVHWNNGFIMNLAGNQMGQSFEFHLLGIATSVSIMVSGAGRWSVDRVLEHPRTRITRERAAEECTVQPPSHL